MRSLGLAVLVGLALPRAVLAQAPVSAPNPMASHTVAIVVIVGSFLAWAASFSYHTIKARPRTDERALLKARREAILDQLAETEQALELERLSQEEYRRRTKELRGELARVIVKLGELSPAPRKRR